VLRRGPARPVPTPTREAELLLRCARLALGPPDQEGIRSLVRQGIAWAELLRLARHHRLTPLLFRSLGSLPNAGVPTEVLDALRHEFVVTATHGLHLAGSLRDTLALLEEHGIRALPYKGPVLAQQLYGDVAFRQMTDLDVLVRRADVPLALELLAGYGYRSPYNPTPRQVRALLRSDNNYPLQSDGTRPSLELHWAFAVRHPMEALDLDELLGGLGSVRLAGREMPAFGADDLLLVLCFHGARHMWERLAWLADVAELVRAGGIDWERVAARAERFSSRRALLVGLHLAHRLLDAPVPVSVLERASADPVVRRLAEQVLTRLFGGDERPTNSIGAPFHLFQLRTIDGVGGRLRYLCRFALLPTPADWEAVPLADSLFPLYFVLRPFRLATGYRARRRERRGSMPGGAALPPR
jgi:hypothetical protein